ncbi:MAG TPA: hypothetical protein VN380_04690 [Thermoanaerobaculia bacterium]|jgi:hypothetical protein|nr:hypothetical protein [Thermoanaerobaculia bacterium]
MTETSSEKNVDSWTVGAIANSQKTLLVIISALFAAAPVIARIFFFKINITHTPAQLIFFGLAPLPGLIGLITYVSSQKGRYELQKDELAQMESLTPATDTNFADASKFEPSFVAWLTGALLLTGVFLIVAVLAPHASSQRPAEMGIVFAGYGTYVSTLWFMLGRLNAHALSPRFLLNSALKASIGILIGFIAAMSVGFFGKPESAMSAQMLLFMIGFFHDWALGYIRKKAVELFQVNQAGTAPELPLAMIEGVDDAAADLLDELGISTAQHLAMQSPVELSMRSLYPIKRVIDWIDQALLTLYFRDKIVAARELGVRGMSEFIAVYEQAAGIHAGRADQAKELMTVLAQKLGMSESALYLMAGACRHDDSVKFLYDLRHFNEMPPSESPAPPSAGDDRLEILKANEATPQPAKTVNVDANLVRPTMDPPAGPPS